MREKGILFGLVVFLAAVLAPVSTASGQSNEERIEKLEAMLKSIQAQLAAIKQEQKTSKESPAAVNQEQIDQMVSKAIGDNNSVTGVPQWVQDVKLFGDFRYRHEIRNQTTAAEQRDRDRIRARIGLKAKINDEVDATFRVATGESDSPISANESLGHSNHDTFSSKDIWLDWAYADWHPEGIDGLNVYAGKMKQPFYNVGKHQVIWDGDVSPEGIVAGYGFDIDSETTAKITGGGFWLNERSADVDSSMWGIQGYAKRMLGDDHILGGVTYYDMGNVEDRTLAGVSLNGNTDDGSGGYEYDYNMLEAFGEYGFSVCDMPSALYGTFIENTRAPKNSNQAYLIGCRLNKTSGKPGTWQFVYNWREVESDAVFAGLSDGDFLFGGTGGKTHKFGLLYQLNKNTQGALSIFTGRRDQRSGDDTSNFHMIQTDLIFKF